MKLDALIEISKRYGADESFVIAGGGNTSYKAEGKMFVKASGTSLADIGPEGLVGMDLAKLAVIMQKSYPEDSETRESEALSDLMEARLPGEEKRPSVETLLHGILPYAYVIHTHPALVNGLTCGKNGESAVEELFGQEALFVPVVNPGYILAKTVKESLEMHREGGGGDQIIFLQNHGVFVQADSVEEIDAIYKRIIDAVGRKIKRQPEEGFVLVEEAAEEALLSSIDTPEGMCAAGGVNKDLNALLSDKASSAFELAPTPDHIVYCGFKPLIIDSLDDLKSDYYEYTEAYGTPPKLLVVKQIGAFGLGQSRKSARIALSVFLDWVKIAVYAESFGGLQLMPEDKIDFIRNWEAEQFRKKMSGV